MTFLEMIQRVDTLFPNPFNLDEKMDFARELSDTLNVKYIRMVDFDEFVYSKDFKMPVHLTADTVCGVHLNGQKYKFSHFMNLISRGLLPEGSKFTVEHYVCPRVTLDDPLPVSNRFDALFIYYVLSKIHLHLDDIASYDNFVHLYNAMLREYVNSLNDRSDDGITQFKNIW